VQENRVQKNRGQATKGRKNGKHPKEWGRKTDKVTFSYLFSHYLLLFLQTLRRANLGGLFKRSLRSVPWIGILLCYEKKVCAFSLSGEAVLEGGMGGIWQRLHDFSIVGMDGKIYLSKVTVFLAATVELSP
jgi:hypothetical protein